MTTSNMLWVHVVTREQGCGSSIMVRHHVRWNVRDMRDSAHGDDRLLVAALKIEDGTWVKVQNAGAAHVKEKVGKV